MSIQYLSEASLESLKQELETIQNKTIPDIAKRIDEAKQQGDLSENAEYHQAREDMSWTQSRMIELEQLIQNAVLIKKSKNHDKVTIGSTVVVKFNGKTKEYTIVGAQEADPMNGKISNESPLGMSFLNKKAKEKFEVTTPAGKHIYEIVEIK